MAHLKSMLFRKCLAQPRLKWLLLAQRSLGSATTGTYNSQPTEQGLDRMMKLEEVFSYHQDSKHHPERYAKGPGYMDWANQPNPFRVYSGAQIVPLDLTNIDDNSSPMSQVLATTPEVPVRPLDAQFIAQLFRDCLSLSAWKSHKSSRWALRCNPSSGNLHPTEAFLICGPVKGLTEKPIVAHYRPKEHAIEVRAEFPLAAWNKLVIGDGILIGMSSVHWREAWKYGERAFRYCQHDIGHAVEAIELAGGAMGWSTRLIDNELTTGHLRQLMGLKDTMSTVASSYEEPECLLHVTPSDSRNELHLEGLHQLAVLLATQPWYGEANILSQRQIPWPRIHSVAKATEKDSFTAIESARPNSGSAFPTMSSVPIRKMIHQRRSAQSFDPLHEPIMKAEQFYSFLQSCRAQFPAVPWEPCVHLAIMVHRIEGLQPGLYLLCRNPAHLHQLRTEIDNDYLWKRPSSCPLDLDLFQLVVGDAREVAKTVSCHQEIASDSSFALGMLAHFEDEINKRGAWFYKRLFWEAGMIGQRLYLQAEACGFRGTGIGCYFDDLFHSVLGLETYKFQSLYHFTVGFPETDERLVTSPPYSHLSSPRSDRK